LPPDEARFFRSSDYRTKAEPRGQRKKKARKFSKTASKQRGRKKKEGERAYILSASQLLCAMAKVVCTQLE
jgi:hypothetical protein